jgi:hypothetical protein
VPVATIPSAPTGAGRWSVKASSIEPVSHASRWASSVRITGIAFSWTGATTALALVVKKLKSRCSPSAGVALVPRRPFHSWPGRRFCFAGKGLLGGQNMRRRWQHQTGIASLHSFAVAAQRLW